MWTLYKKLIDFCVRSCMCTSHFLHIRYIAFLSLFNLIVHYSLGKAGVPRDQYMAGRHSESRVDQHVCLSWDGRLQLYFFAADSPHGFQSGRDRHCANSSGSTIDECAIASHAVHSEVVFIYRCPHCHCIPDMNSMVISRKLSIIKTNITRYKVIKKLHYYITNY